MARDQFELFGAVVGSLLIGAAVLVAFPNVLVGAAVLVLGGGIALVARKRG